MQIIRGSRDRNSCYVESNYGLLLFDTGAAQSQLLRSDVTDTLPQLGIHESGGLLGRVQQVQAVVPELLVGEEIRAKDLPITIDEREGLLGMDVLKDYAFAFDMDRDEIRFLKPFTEGLPILHIRGNHIFIQIELQGRPYFALVDTGASCTLLDVNCYESLEGHLPERIESGSDWTGAALETPITTLEGLKIGDICFPAHEVALYDLQSFAAQTDYPIIAILGATTLSLHTFAFSLPTRTFRIEN